MPGFVDTHAHLRPGFGVHKTQPWAYLANLAYGVTTTRDPQTGTTDVLTYGDLVETGDIVGPRIYSTGPGVFSAEDIEDLDHARNVLRRYSDYYDTKTIKMYMSGNRQQRQWIVMAAREQELLPTTEGALDMKYDLEMIVDGYPGLEHSFPIFPLYRDVVQLTAHTRVAYTPTAAGLVRRPVRRELVLYAGESARRSEASALHAPQRARPPDAPSRSGGRTPARAAGSATRSTSSGSTPRV